jgi:NAD-dependent dihydropyrimidine dehydrogenase PreA subunit
MVKGIVIDESRCDGCGLCVAACHEGALALIDGKAKMVREDFCDGLGDCLPVCPQGAISFIGACGCETPKVITLGVPQAAPAPAGQVPAGQGSSELRQWPVKLRLVSSASPILKNADVLLAADCAAFAYSKAHEHLIKGRAVLICCPKFDPDIAEKLAEILSRNEIKTLTVARMSVPCCSLDKAADDAVKRSGKKMPLRIVTIDQRGNVK